MSETASMSTNVNDWLALIAARLERVEALLTERGRGPGADVPPVLTARELMERWDIDPASPNARQRLSRQCLNRRLRPLSGTRGLRAVFRLQDVLDAESRR